MKGIILAAGRGTRLHPVTLVTCKQLLPVYDKPMIYYPLSVLMLAGIKDILIITTPDDLSRFQKLLGDGSHLGISILYECQVRPNGIAEALIIGENFIGEDAVALILGDNIFYGHHLSSLLQNSKKLESGAVVFGYEVKDPSRYGVVEFDDHFVVKNIVEKPKNPQSNYAITGLYFYDHHAIEIAKSLIPSKRGELEITDVNLAYLSNNNLQVKILERGFAWLDTGTHEALQQASSYVQTIQERQGIKIACIEEIAFRMNYIDKEQLEALIQKIAPSEYADYLFTILSKIAREEFKLLSIS